MILHEYCLCNVFSRYQAELNFVYYEENLVVRDKLRKFQLTMAQIFMHASCSNSKSICIGKTFNEFLKNQINKKKKEQKKKKKTGNVSTRRDVVQYCEKRLSVYHLSVTDQFKSFQHLSFCLRDARRILPLRLFQQQKQNNFSLSLALCLLSPLKSNVLIVA